MLSFTYKNLKTHKKMFLFEQFHFFNDKFYQQKENYKNNKSFFIFYN